MPEYDYENEFAGIWIEDGIMCCVYKTDVLSLDVAKECVNLRCKAAAGKDYLTFIDLTKLKSVDKEAREYMSSEGTFSVKASALLIDSAISKFIANFFLQVNKPKIPTRLFTSKSAAFKWLRQQ